MVPDFSHILATKACMGQEELWHSFKCLIAKQLAILFYKNKRVTGRRDGAHARLISKMQGMCVICEQFIDGTPLNNM